MSTIWLDGNYILVGKTSNIVGNAPTNLDTLEELAAAIGNDTEIYQKILAILNADYLTENKADIKYQLKGNYVSEEELNSISAIKADKDELEILEEQITSNYSELESAINLKASKSDLDEARLSINNTLSSVYKVKGSVLTFDLLPMDAETGDVYNILDDGTNYVCLSNSLELGIVWDKLSETIDTSYLLSKEEFNSVIETEGSGDMFLSNNGEYKNISLAVDLSLLDIYGNPIKRSTANCYIVTKPGVYKFPLIYGNAITNGRTNLNSYSHNGGDNSSGFYNGLSLQITTPKISEITSAQLSICDTNNIFTNIVVKEGYIEFNITNVPFEGANAIISALHEEQIVWNWHIWAWSDDLSTIELINMGGYKYLIFPINLASKWDSDKQHIKNWHYQWGRPIPLICSQSYNSSTIHENFGSLTPTISECASLISDGITNPQIFYKSNSAYNYNWFLLNSGNNYNLWDSYRTVIGSSDSNTIKTVYDPCPVGFKVPNGNVFNSFSPNNIVGSFNNGYRFKTNSSDTVGVWFPTSGGRGYNSGTLNGVGSDGSIWTSSPSSNSLAHNLYFNNGTASSSGRYYWAGGYSIRPISETATLGNVEFLVLTQDLFDSVQHLQNVFYFIID